MKYYRLTEDMSIHGRWYLSPINNVSYEEQWNFIVKPFFQARDTLNVPIKIQGTKTDYTENLTYNIPIISNKAKIVLEKYGISLSQVNILDLQDEEKNSYYAMGVDILDCVNEDFSEYIKYEESDHVAPDRIGDYKFFNKLVLDKEKINTKHIFRIKGFLIYLIVSEELKECMESQLLSGVLFEEIASDS